MNYHLLEWQLHLVYLLQDQHSVQDLQDRQQ